MLGLVLTPYGRVPGAYPFEINKSGPDSAAFLCPRDPYYFQRGEYGFYYDTPLGGARGLGAIPTDAEIGQYYTNWYTPVQSGWVVANQPRRYIPGPWVPPDNATAYPPYGPPTSLNGLGEVTSMDLFRLIEEHNRKNFNLTLLATTAAVAASIMTFINNYKKARHEHNLYQPPR